MKTIAQVIIILFSVVSISLADSDKVFTSGKWNWQESGEKYVWAATTNSAKHVFGQYCRFDSGNCVYLVVLGIECKEGNSYPALVNSDHAAIPVTLICGDHNDFFDTHVMFVSPFDKIDEIVRQGNRIAFAVGMESDNFKVGRFSLSGSTKAVNAMRNAAETINKYLPASKKDEQYL